MSPRPLSWWVSLAIVSLGGGWVLHWLWNSTLAALGAMPPMHLLVGVGLAALCILLGVFSEERGTPRG